VHTINQLTLDNTAIALIDHQPFVAFPVESISATELINNTIGLAKVAKALGVPTVLTTINARGGPLQDPLFIGITDVFPEITPIDRHNTNAWSDAAFVDAIKATGRTKLVMAGLWTEVCVAQTALSAKQAGYDVFVVTDASGGVSREAHERGVSRMIQAGIVPITWQAVMAELCPDNTAPQYPALYQVVIQHGQGVSNAVQYVLANLGQPGPTDRPRP
jgi:nicotinamidase-related amidase